MNGTAGDMMVPLDEYPVIDASPAVPDAVMNPKESRRNMAPGRKPSQVVPVAESEGTIIGKPGRPAFRIFDRFTNILFDCTRRYGIYGETDIFLHKIGIGIPSGPGGKGFAYIGDRTV